MLLSAGLDNPRPLMRRLAAFDDLGPETPNLELQPELSQFTNHEIFIELNLVVAEFARTRLAKRLYIYIQASQRCR